MTKIKIKQVRSRIGRPKGSKKDFGCTWIKKN